MIGLAVLFAGFVPLGTMWRFGNYSHQRGLFYYDSASWGDGLLLPLMAAALVWMIQQLPFGAGAAVRTTSALVGLAAGAAVISNWLGEDSIPNWTMPTERGLNLPGYVHAVFLLGSSALFAALWTEFFVRLRKAFAAADESGRRVLGSGGFALAAGTSLAFCLLVARDNVEHGGLTQAGFSSLAALSAAAAALAAALAWAAGRRAGYALAAVVSGLLFAWALNQASLLDSPDPVVIAFIAAAGAFGLAVGMTPERVQTAQANTGRANVEYPSSVEVIAVPSVFILLPVNVGLVENGHPVEMVKVGGSLVVGLALVAFIWWLRRGQHDLGRDARWFFTATVFVTATSGALAFSRIVDREAANASTSLAFALLATLLAGPAMRLCDADLQRIVALEIAVQSEGNRGFTVVETLQRRHSYSRLAASGTAAIFSIVGLTLLTGYAVGWRPGEVVRPWTSMGLPAAVVVAFSAVLLLYSVHGRGEPAGPPASAIARFTVTLTMCFSGVVLVLSSLLTNDSPPDWYAALLSLCIAAFGGNCILGNGLRVGLVRPTPASWIVIFCVTSGIFVMAYWTLTEGIGTSGAPALVGESTLSLLVGILVSGLLMVTSTVAIFGNREDMNRRNGVRLQDGVQDFLMLATMWTLMAWLPRLIAAHIPEQSIAPYKWVIAATIFAGFLALYVSALLWIIKINDGHVGRKMTALGIVPDPYCAPDAHHLARLRSIRHRLPPYFTANTQGTRSEREIRALGAHTAAQNSISLALVALTISGLLWLAIADWES